MKKKKIHIKPIAHLALQIPFPLFFFYSPFAISRRLFPIANSLLAAGFYSEGRLDESLVIAN